MLTTHLLTWSIAALVILGVIIRPGQLPEALWAVLGAVALLSFSLIPPSVALQAALRGSDVYFFLTGMMLLSELARREGLFDWLALYALRHAAGSGRRLFLLVYGVGTLVTVFLSNDATAVVLTPAVYAVARQARVEPLPYLLICAFIANAASFVLPISNPANLVVFGEGMPSLGAWLREFGGAAVLAIMTTLGLLYLSQRAHLGTRLATPAQQLRLPGAGRVAALGIVVTGVLLLVASARGWQLGLPTCLAGIATWLAVSSLSRQPWAPLRHITWSVLPLVAGLFVLVQAVEDTGVLMPLAQWIARSSAEAPERTAVLGGLAVGMGSNLINNLPMGLLAATMVHTVHLGATMTAALLIGVDLGPNLSVTGSLATILWLIAIRREGLDMPAWRFLRLGVLIMPLPLLCALLACLGSLQ